MISKRRCLTTSRAISFFSSSLVLDITVDVVVVDFVIIVALLATMPFSVVFTTVA